MTTAEQDRQRSPIQDGLGQIAVYVAGVLSKIASDQDLVEVLHDHELLALDAWTEGTDPTLRAECEDRQAKHQELARRFAVSGQTELVAILAERVKHF